MIIHEFGTVQIEHERIIVSGWNIEIPPSKRKGATLNSVSDWIIEWAKGRLEEEIAKNNV